MVQEGIEFTVHDAKTGEDITRAVLTQIIVEEEAKGVNLLPLSFLRQLISFYGDNMQRTLLPHYLEYSIDAFAKNQEEMQKYMEGTFGNMFPCGQFEKIGKQNQEMIEQAMRIFSPFEAPKRGSEESSKVGNADSSEDIQSLQRQLNALQTQLNKINGDN